MRETISARSLRAAWSVESVIGMDGRELRAPSTTEGRAGEGVVTARGGKGCER